jgi:hypothetical protein
MIFREIKRRRVPRGEKKPEDEPASDVKVETKQEDKK